MKNFTILRVLRINLCFFCYCILVSNIYSQNGKASISGLIKSNDEVLEYALVVLEKTGFGTTTDEKGNFVIKHVSPGEYSINASLLGFKTFRKSIVLQSDQELKVDIELTPEANQHEEVVVTGTMKESYTTMSPIKVDVVTSAYFKKNPTPSIFEALQMVNGVQPQLNCNVCNTGDIHINGMEGPYTMVTIDGMPIVSSLSTVYGLSGIPNSMIKRVEIVKGPASTLYGSEAVGGLINIITKEPSVAPLFSFDAFTTSQREMNLDMSGKSRIGKAHILLGLNYFNFNNKMDVNKDNFTDVTLQNRISVFNKWSFDRKEGRQATIAGRFVFEDRWGGELNWAKEHRGSDSIYGESISTRRFELIGNYQLPLKEKLTLQYSLNTHQQNSFYGYTPFKAEQNIAFTQLLWDKKFGDRHDILVGLPMRYTYYDDNTPGTANGDSLNLSNKPQNTFLPGIFVQDQFKVTEKFTLLPGVRYDYNSTHGSIVSPRISFKYDLNKNNILRLSGGNGYRVVNLFTEEHAALTGARKVVVANHLKPERSWNANINYQTFINRTWGFIGIDGSLFYTYFTNKIVGDFLTDPNKIFFDNLNGYAVSKGMTLNVDFTFNNSLKIVSGVTAMDVYRIENDIRFQQLHAPKLSGTFAVSYTLKNIGLAIDYTGRINGPMELPVLPNDYRPATSPWYSLQNIQLTKKIQSYMELYGGIKNIFNFIPKNPLIHSSDPFDRPGGQYFLKDGSPNPITNPNNYNFDTEYNYAPVQGIRGFLGVRVTLS